jgi:hypothetical protein
MSINISTKERAIQLRKDGKTYSEILKEIPVAKSTLSEWFKEVSLSKRQFQKLTIKKLEAARRGGKAKRKQRLERMSAIREESLSQIKNISNKELLIIGTVLYWAEGTKEKEYRPGSGIQFSNSDPRMINIFILWLKRCCEIDDKRIVFEIYIHENYKNDIERFKLFWSKSTGYNLEYFNRIYFKTNKIKTNRKNTNNLYYGLIRVRVLSSSDLVRKISGWTEAIYKNI